MRERLKALHSNASSPARATASGRTPVLHILSAGFVLVSGGVHLVGWLGLYSLLPVIGPLFLLNACSALLLALALILARPVATRLRLRLIEPLVLLAGWGFAALTLAAFLISTTRGLFGFQERLTGTAQLTAGIAEVLTLITTGWALVSWLLRSGQELRHPFARTHRPRGFGLN